MNSKPRKFSIAFVISLLILGSLACRNERQRQVRKDTSASVESQSRARELGKPEVASLLDARRAIEPLFTPMREPQEYDWLAFNEEQGQTFEQYLGSDPALPHGARRVLYVQPLGDFTDTQRRIVALTARYMSEFFNLHAELKPELPMPNIPAKARRVLPRFSSTEKPRKQILAGYVINEILRPQLPGDAAALIAFTASDLYPEESWHYVFGQASFRERVGVWSLHRLGTPDASQEEFVACLRRTMKLATHETGHMFSIPHCTKYECDMSGTNSLAETDRRPLDYCPECMAKICWATGTDPRERYQKLAAFAQVHGLTDDAHFFQTAMETLDRNSNRNSSR